MVAFYSRQTFLRPTCIERAHVSLIAKMYYAFFYTCRVKGQFWFFVSLKYLPPLHEIFEQEIPLKNLTRTVVFVNRFEKLCCTFCDKLDA